MWGQHYIGDIKGSEYGQGLIQNEEHIRNFCKTLIEKIDMKAYGECHLHHFASHNDEACGYSMVQLIETSNICAHFVDKNGDIYLDIFSCKSFDERIVDQVIENFWQPSFIKSMSFKRDAR